MWQQGYLLAVCKRVLFLKTRINPRTLISMLNKAWRCRDINTGSVWTRGDLKNSDNPGLNSVQEFFESWLDCRAFSGLINPSQEVFFFLLLLPFQSNDLDCNNKTLVDFLSLLRLVDFDLHVTYFPWKHLRFVSGGWNKKNRIQALFKKSVIGRYVVLRQKKFTIENMSIRNCCNASFTESSSQWRNSVS